MANVETKEEFLKNVQSLCERYNIGRRTKFLNMNYGVDSSVRGQGGGGDVEEQGGGGGHPQGAQGAGGDGGQAGGVEEPQGGRPDALTRGDDQLPMADLIETNKTLSKLNRNKQN